MLSSLLGEYLTGATEIVFEREGTVAKIIGDAIHVLFGAPADQPDAAARAIDCALALDNWSQAFRLRWGERGVALGPTRIGVHAGPALVGNFGGGRLFDYTAYGDTINAAARLEAANKTLGTRICVSAAAVERAGAFLGRPVGDLVLRGRSEPLRAYEAFGGGGRRGRLYASVRQVGGQRPGAVAAFAALVGANPKTRSRSIICAAFSMERPARGSKSADHEAAQPHCGAGAQRRPRRLVRSQINALTCGGRDNVAKSRLRRQMAEITEKALEIQAAAPTGTGTV